MYEENIEYHKELLRLQKMASITTLAGDIAHNINNLMGAVIGYADMLHDNLATADNNERTSRYTEKILEASQRVADMTQNLLIYARAGRSDFSKVNLKELLERMIRLYGKKNSDKVYIDLQIPQNIPGIQGDSNQIFQALSHIFIYAQEVVLDDGTTIVTAKTGKLPSDNYFGDTEPEAENYVIISILDTGVGMDKETVEKIFDPLSTEKQTEEAILGLSAAYSIIQRHKGAISVDTKLGEGSAFHIYLPISQGD